MSDLRSKVIRLASTMPKGSPERKALLAALKVARGDWQPVAANAQVRIQMKDHPDNALVIQELPTKPVKRQLRRREYNTYYMVQNLHGGSQWLMSNIAQDAKFSPGGDFDAAVRTMDAALAKAKDEFLAESIVLHEKYKVSHPGIYPVYTEADLRQLGWPRSLVQDEMVSWLEVEPADYKPVTFKGKGFGGTSEWTKFRFYDEKDDDEFMRQVEGMSAYYMSKSPGGSRTLFKLLKADPTIVQNMTGGQFREFLTKNKVGFEYVPTVWR